MAWGNNVPDLMNNTSLARDGFPSMAVAACFAGPLFALLVGMGAALGLGAATHRGVLPVPIDASLLVMLVFGALNLIKYGAVVPLACGYGMRRSLALSAFVFYAVFNAVYGAAVAGLLPPGLWPPGAPGQSPDGGGGAGNSNSNGNGGC